MRKRSGTAEGEGGGEREGDRIGKAERRGRRGQGRREKGSRQKGRWEEDGHQGERVRAGQAFTAVSA